MEGQVEGQVDGIMSKAVAMGGGAIGKEGELPPRIGEVVLRI